MRKHFCGNRLRSSCRPGARRAAFSLAELVVSIGILVLMMALAGQVFSTTIKSTGQATALTRVSQILRTFERTLRDDLKHVQPGQSMLLIQGNPVNAYWTENGPDADTNTNPSDGYGHQADPARQRPNGTLVKPRADILMFFTARRGSSFIHPGVTSHLQQVVYGHAEQGEYLPNPPTDPNPYSFEPSGSVAFPVNTAKSNYPSPTIVTSVPASRWHLARRNVLLMPTSSPPPPSGEVLTPWVGALNVAPVPARAMGLADERILLGETDIVGDFNYESFVLTPGITLPHFLPSIFDSGFPVGRPFDPAKVPFARSKLDINPPTQRGDRLGHYFVPNCATFKVEWTLDPKGRFVDGRLDGGRDILWFDPGAEPEAGEHPMKSLVDAIESAKSKADPDALFRDLLIDRTNHPDGDRYSLADRFLGPDLGDKDLAWPALAPDGRPNLVVFAAARRTFDSRVVVEEDIFPTALRVTIDVFDTERRLARPVRHVMVIPIGE